MRLDSKVPSEFLRVAKARVAKISCVPCRVTWGCESSKAVKLALEEHRLDQAMAAAVLSSIVLESLIEGEHICGGPK